MGNGVVRREEVADGSAVGVGCGNVISGVVDGNDVIVVDVDVSADVGCVDVVVGSCVRIGVGVADTLTVADTVDVADTVGIADTVGVGRRGRCDPLDVEGVELRSDERANFEPHARSGLIL